MIEYKNGIVVMSLVDLEHCGFDVRMFEFRTSFVVPPDISCDWPIALLVNFAGGAVVTPKTTGRTRARMAEADTRFQALRRKLEE